MSVSIGELDSSIGYLLRRANSRIREGTLEVLAAHGLSQLELSALYLLDHNPGCKPKDLSLALGTEPQGVNRIINSLSDKGWVERTPSAVDRRSVAVYITASGRAKMQQAAGGVREVEQAFVDALGEAVPEFVAQLKTLALA